MEEHIFLKDDDILVSSTRLVIDNKTIVMGAISSIELDKEEVSPPWFFIVLTVFALLIALISPYYSQIGWFLFLIGLVITLLLWLKKGKEAIVIEHNSGEKTYLTNSEVDDLETVFKALNEVIIFRG